MTENTVPLSKSEKNKVLFGVCGGIGEYFNIDPNIIRIAFVLFTMIGGSGLVAYIAAAILMPEYQEAGSPESERKAPVDSGNTILIIGAVLVIIGIFYLLREAHFYFLPFWIENWIWRRPDRANRSKSPRRILQVRHLFQEVLHLNERIHLVQFIAGTL